MSSQYSSERSLLHSYASLFHSSYSNINKRDGKEENPPALAGYDYSHGGGALKRDVCRVLQCKIRHYGNAGAEFESRLPAEAISLPAGLSLQDHLPRFQTRNGYPEKQIQPLHSPAAQSCTCCIPRALRDEATWRPTPATLGSAAISWMSSCDLPHFRSGLRRMTPRPEHGASSSIRSKTQARSGQPNPARPRSRSKCCPVPSGRPDPISACLYEHECRWRQSRLILHQLAHVGALPARGAAIQHPHSRLRLYSLSDQHGAFILDRDHSIPVPIGQGHIACSLYNNPVGTKGRWGDFKALVAH